MFRIVAATAAVLAMSAMTANARPHRGVVDEFCGSRYCAAAESKPRRVKRSRSKPKIKRPPIPRTIYGYASRSAPSVALNSVTPVLAAKVRKIVHVCGSRVVSAFRPNARIAGSGRASLHSRYPAEAVDLVGNPGCIYRHLRGWPGGVSTDYAQVRHVHVSLASDRRERGARFAHYRPKQRWAMARRGR